MAGAAALVADSAPPALPDSSTLLPSSSSSLAPLDPLPLPDDADSTMTDDVRVAVSALGLMREGSLCGSTSSQPSHLPPPHPSASPFYSPSTSTSLPRSAHHSRTASSLYRSDPSRSTSTASTASASEAWTTATTSDTGFSSPVGTASVSALGLDDAEMLNDKGVGLGEAELDSGRRDGDEGEEQHQDPRFMARVSQLPYVSGGLEWYERSKASSRVVKLGADLVESSFSAVSRPITNNVQLGGLDDFACRQLDRISAGSPGRKSPRSAAAQLAVEEEEERGRSSGRTPLGRTGSADLAAVGERGGTASSEERGRTAGGQVAVAQRSRWQTVLVEAGGLGAAVSEESLKSLRYCLQWLLYATAHLDHQIATLRDFILSLRAHNRSSSPSSNALVAASASAHLSQIKHDVVETIRKVVEVVSKYAGAALPEQAKRYVRQSILGLPVKWASAIENRVPGGANGGPITAAAARRRRERSGSAGGWSVGGGGGTQSEVGTPRPERMHESYFSRPDGMAGSSSSTAMRDTAQATDDDGAAELSPTEDAADRVLTFAVESLDMLRAVTSIFGESVEKAEAWIERLRIVGLDRQRQRQAGAAGSSFPPSSSSLHALPPSHAPSTSTSPTLSSSATFDDTPTAAAGTKRRRASTRASNSGGVDGEGGLSNGATTTGTDAARVTDEEGEGLGRRKRGAWRDAVNGGA
ncbi:hypothetical protein JCM8547_000854 [Rhodosporidiobolus lusitaniae]